jgi:hypothetical protein
MYQQVDIQKLSAKLSRLEAEIAAIRKELEALPQQPAKNTLRETAVTYKWVDKTALKEQFARLLSDLDIQGQPIGAEALQQKIREAGLDKNELSQSIIAMREE